MIKRIKQVLDKLHEKGGDGILITSVENVSYLTGFSGDSSHLILSYKGTFLLTDGRYTEQAKNECPSGIEIFKWLDDKRFGIDTYRYITQKLNIKLLFFEGGKLSFSDYMILKEGLSHVQLISENNIVEEFRQIKDDNEIEFLRTACKISDLALEKTIALIKPGITELELTASLDFNLLMSGAEDISFKTIVLSGTRTSLLHGSPGNKKINNGEIILFDFGALFKGYHADISRTVILGKANDIQKEIYTIVKEAQSKAIESIYSGQPGNLPDSIVRSIIPKKYIDYYYPGMGHGVGLQIHEEPFIRNTSEFIFKTNMVITVEPGIYIPGWGGIRIEDTLLVKDNDSDLLSKYTRELVELL